MNTRFTLLAVLAAALPLASSAVTTDADTASHRIDEVVVTGARYKSDVRHLPMTISVVGNDKLNENHISSVIPTLTRLVPGFFSTSRGIIGYGVSTGAAGAMRVRGIGSMANLLVLIDGLPQYAGLYGHPIADSYRTMLAEKVEVLRGPASVIYGSNAMGGVVNIVTRQSDGQGIHTDISLQGGSYGTVETSAVSRMRSGRMHAVAGASYARTDGHRKNSDFEQVGGFLKLGYDIDSHWAVTADADLNYFESANPGTVANPLTDNFMMITRGMASLSLTNEYERTSGALRTFFNWGHHHINDGYGVNGTPQTAFYLHNDRMGGFSVYQSVALTKGNRITAGVDYFSFGGRAWNRTVADGTEKDIIDKTVDEVAGYVDVRQDITPWLIADAALRLNHHSVAGSEWVPQGGLTWLLPGNARVKAMVGKGFRNAVIRELFMYKPANKDLEPERMWNYELSFRQSLMDGRLGYGVNVFYLKAENMIATVMTDGKPLNVNTGKTENSGVEVEADYSIGSHWNVNANYSFLHMSNPQLASPEHKAFVGAACRYGRFTANAGMQYVAGLYTAVGANEHKESFLLLNVTAGYMLHRGLQAFAKGDNLLAQRYETIAGFPMPKAVVMAGANWSF